MQQESATDWRAGTLCRRSGALYRRYKDSPGDHSFHDKTDSAFPYDELHRAGQQTLTKSEEWAARPSLELRHQTPFHQLQELSIESLEALRQQPQQEGLLKHFPMLRNEKPKSRINVSKRILNKMRLPGWVMTLKQWILSHTTAGTTVG
ncbi:hypothetical protein [Circovirus-like genome DCCV-5]|uniref:Uncharacterized protein n=1 Tax=Circovirus-like genome DCCV-5 TaxID=1788445 RepID=A0A190WHJ3_9VIRU|nr:hypothetical protein [Circovirus-like genome DCCV-5]AMB42965.1 hypothetical protein [Circovirus-like genome DCCV-5]